ncbi:hypothetical protein G3I40_00750 [Streptomyces sp. SID14478]|uniref:toxin-antitoxin system YwqK family antitoxin n=1 Tax=Streptomyces sp. SID14478 TaxID=2706073 RepID=UPI0013DB32FE|nr:hypothetical protein [Streptomyces sp. SID14478]NEB73780.1 hypothetical protein [Streptomyces sp. SID14478]
MRVNQKDIHTDEDLIAHYEEDEPFTGEVVSHDKEGRMIRLATYVSGILSGPQLQWYPDGTKRSEGRAKQGVVVGEWRKWHPNGRLAEQTFYSTTGCEEGFREWDKDGTLVDEGGRAPEADPPDTPDAPIDPAGLH